MPHRVWMSAIVLVVSCATSYSIFAAISGEYWLHVAFSGVVMDCGIWADLSPGSVIVIRLVSLSIGVSIVLSVSIVSVFVAGKNCVCFINIVYFRIIVNG